MWNSSSGWPNAIACSTCAAQVTNQLHALEQEPVVIGAVRQRMEVLIATLNAQIKEVEKEITPVLQQDEAWAKAAALLQTITGVGLVTAAWLVTSTLTVSICPSPEAAVAYAGLVPYVRESGTSVRGKQAISRSGNKRLRRTLYLATLSATRFNPQIKAFYTRLRAAGKPAKVARCAAARKLLHLAWAVVTKGRAYDPAYQPDGAAPPSAAA
jgi:transposase